MSINDPEASGIFAIAAALLTISVRFIRFRKLDQGDAGKIFVALFSGFLLNKGLFLTMYLFFPDPPEVPTKLHGYENEVSAAGFLMCFMAVSAIYSLFGTEENGEEKDDDEDKTDM